MPTRLVTLPMIDDATPELFGVAVEKWEIKTNYHDVAKVEVTAKADALDKLIEARDTGAKVEAEATAVDAHDQPTEHTPASEKSEPKPDTERQGALGPEKDPEKDPTPAGPSPQRDLPRAERGGGSAARPQER